MKTPYLAQPGSEDTATGLPDWRELAAIVIERFWFGLAAAIVVFLFILFRLTQAVPYYRSTAVLMVEPIQPRLLNYQEVVGSNIRNIEYFNTIIKTLHSRQMMENALMHSGLAERRDFFPHIPDLSGKAAAALSLFNITGIEKTRLVQVSVEHPDPRIASDLANAMARSYIQQELDNRMTASMLAVEWLRARSVEYREKLEQGLMALQKYREEALSVSLEEDQNIIIAKLKSLNATLTSAQTDRIDAQSRWESIASRIEMLVPADSSANLQKLQMIAQDLDNPVLSETLFRLRAQQQQVVRLRERYKSDHPDLKDALQQERQLLLEFQQMFDAAVYAIRHHYETLLAREQNLTKALQDQEQESFRLARQLVEYNDLKRNIDADKEIYESVIARMKEASLSGSLPSEVIRLAEDARPAGAPFRPNRPRVLLRGGMLAVAAGLGLIFLLYYFDHRFRRHEEIERALGMPVIAALPVIRGRNVRDRGMIAHDQPAGEVAEAFRTLRAIMEINPAVENAKVLLVTSAHPSEGKSLVALNLALSCAQDNRRTLLIGADLRRPVFSKFFPDNPRNQGLSDVLSGETDWKTSLEPASIPNLDVLSSGSMRDRPAELLGCGRFRDMLAGMREAYDRIVIDAPPVLGISDTLVLLKQADGVLFVVRHGVTNSMGAVQAMKRIKASGTVCVGVVMNGVDLRSMANSYRYRQYGGYAYQHYIKGTGEVPDESSGGTNPTRRSWFSGGRAKGNHDDAP